MAQGNMVNWKDFNPQLVSIEKPQAKQFDNTKNGGAKGNYAIAKLVYSYSAPNGTIVKDDLYLELCETSVRGFQYPQEGSASKDIQIKAGFDITSQSTKEFIGKMNGFYKRLIELILPVKMDLKCKDFTMATASALFKHPIYFPTDSISNEIDDTKNPSQYYKLRNNANQKTNFYSLADTKNAVNWDKLKTAEFKGYPLIVFDRLYAGGNGKISLQSYVSSFVMLPGIRPMGTANRQVGTINNINTEHPDFVDAQKQEISDLERTMAGMSGLSLGSASGNSGTAVKRDNTPLGEEGTVVNTSNTNTTQAPSQAPVPSMNNGNYGQAQIPIPGMNYGQAQAPTPNGNNGNNGVGGNVNLDNILRNQPQINPMGNTINIAGLPAGFVIPGGFNNKQ
jgi:hypothetical protein